MSHCVVTVVTCLSVVSDEDSEPPIDDESAKVPAEAEDAVHRSKRQRSAPDKLVSNQKKDDVAGSQILPPKSVVAP